MTQYNNNIHEAETAFNHIMLMSYPSSTLVQKYRRS